MKSSSNNFTSIIDNDYQEWYEEAFGQWIHGVFPNYKSLTFQEQKEAFFYLLKKLLDDGRVVLCPPISLGDDAPVKKQYNKKGELEWVVVWAIPHEDIIQYMCDAFPKNIENENDDRLYDFWFSEDCPQIGWVDQNTGEIVD